MSEQMTDEEVLANLLEIKRELWHRAIAEEGGGDARLVESSRMTLRALRALAETRKALADMVGLAEHYTDPGIAKPETYARIDEAKHLLKGDDDARTN